LNTPPDSKPEIDKITLTFNKAVKLISAAGVMRSVAGNNIGDNELSSVWKTSGSLDNVFSAINPQSSVLMALSIMTRLSLHLIILLPKPTLL